jgi:hypothetical protein
MKNSIVFEYSKEFFSQHGDFDQGVVFEVIPRSERQGIYLHGFEPCSDETLDIRGWKGFELSLSGSGEFNITLTASLLTSFNTISAVEKTQWSASFFIRKNHNLVAALDQFDMSQSTTSQWRFFKSLTITISRKIESDSSSDISINSFRVLRSFGVALYTPVYSLHAEAGGSVQYILTVVNTDVEPRHVTLIQKSNGREAMRTLIENPAFIMDSGEKRTTLVIVEVSTDLVPGGYEKQLISALSEGNSEATITLYTGCTLPHPFIFGTEEDFQGVQNKVSTASWASELFEEYKRQAAELEIHEIDTHKPFLYQTSTAHIAYRAAVVWKLSGDDTCATKAITLLRRVCDPQQGWPRTKQACNQELVHEGEFFKSLAMTYDLLYDHNAFNGDDRKNIEAVLRSYMELIDFELGRGHLSNWTLAELAGALFSAQVLQDRQQMERFIYGPGGFTDHLSVGVFDDGWWYEVSISYNLMAAGLFTMMAKSCESWGYELAHLKVPAVYSRVVSGLKADQVHDGLCIEAWGPHTKNYRNIEMQWDSLARFADWRGVCFGLSDSCEYRLTAFSIIDPRYDLAWTVFGKSVYADMARRSSPHQRDLIFGAETLPPPSDECPSESLYADNVGIAMLRSQKKGRTPREQIAITLKYGSHGGAHGHYDRLALNSLMRYGRSMSNPENVWYSYHTLMYKFYVQNSVNHNMVTVDLKQQDPTEARRIHYFSGRHIQVCGAENISRWCDPPYGGWRILNGTHSFEEQCWIEGKYVSIPETQPEYTKRGNFTEPVLQRRAVVVTDDYVLIFDYAAAEEEHNFDLIYTIKGLGELTGYREINAQEKAEDNPLSSAQFITDCRQYNYVQGARAAFTSVFDEEPDLADRCDCNEPGELKVDLHTLYPLDGTVLIGNVPANHSVHKQLEYAVEGDKLCLAEGRFGAWVLGRDDISVNVYGVRELTLRVRVTKVIANCQKTIFWGDPRIVDHEGKSIYLSDLKLTMENVSPGNGPGTDYYGGPVKLQARLCPRAIPSEPEDYSREAVIRVSLEGLGAKLFESSIGGDYPPGPEENIRKWHAVRARGKSARFISVLEPFETNRVIVSAKAEDRDTVKVNLADGAIQFIKINGFEDSRQGITVQFTEYKDGIETSETSDGYNKG